MPADRIPHNAHYMLFLYSLNREKEDWLDTMIEVFKRHGQTLRKLWTLQTTVANGGNLFVPVATKRIVSGTDDVSDRDGDDGYDGDMLGRLIGSSFRWSYCARNVRRTEAFSCRRKLCDYNSNNFDHLYGAVTRQIRSR